MTKNIFIFVVLIGAVAATAWALYQKGSGTADEAMGVPSESVSPSPVENETTMEEQQEPEVITHSSGLQYQDLRAGDGAEVKKGDTIAVHYVGRLEDGTQFDSSIDRGEPFSLVIGAGSVIQGWDIGVLGMRVGGVRRLIIPPDLAYGEAGIPGAIPPNATLVFEVQVLQIGQQ